MRKLAVVLATAMLLGVGVASTFASVTQTEVAPQRQPVDGIRFFGRLDNWRAIDRDTLIVWVTPFRAYLIELSRPSADLRFTPSVAITSTTGKVRASLDSVIVRGFHYPIEAIYELSREEARHWGAPGNPAA